MKRSEILALYEKYLKEMPTALMAYGQVLVDLVDTHGLKPASAKKLLDKALGDSK